MIFTLKKVKIQQSFQNGYFRDELEIHPILNFGNYLQKWVFRRYSQKLKFLGIHPNHNLSNFPPEMAI